MAKQVIDISTAQPNGGVGEPIKTAFQKVNANFNEVYEDVGTKLSRSDIVGTVTTDLNTSAIIEQGSNANGDYVKFADGTMICTMMIYSPSTVNWTNGTGGGHKYTDMINATIPHAFIAKPSASYAPGEGAVGYRSGWISYLNATSSTCFLLMSALTTTTNNQQFYVSVTLIGRWK